MTLVVIMWGIFIVNGFTDDNLNALLAIKPRDMGGLFGIATFSFAHVNWGHIVANSVPFVVLSMLIGLSAGLGTLIRVWVIGALGSGVGVWLFSSAGYVVGASGMVFALNGFILAQTYYQPNLRNIVVAIVALVLYSGIILSLFHVNTPGISWTGHVSGFIAGIFAAFLLLKKR